jgi:hypothetical protein
MTNGVPVNFWLRRSELVRLTRAAAEAGISRSALVRLALSPILRPTEPPPESGQPEEEETG